MTASFFGLTLSLDELPLSVAWEKRRQLSVGQTLKTASATAYYVSMLLPRLRMAAKLRAAKRYLWLRGLKPWTDWRPRWME